MTAEEIREAAEELSRMIYGDRDAPKPTGVIIAKGASGEFRSRQFQGLAFWALRRGMKHRKWREGACNEQG